MSLLISPLMIIPAIIKVTRTSCTRGSRALKTKIDKRIETVCGKLQQGHSIDQETRSHLTCHEQVVILSQLRKARARQQRKCQSQEQIARNVRPKVVLKGVIDDLSLADSHHGAQVVHCSGEVINAE